MTKSQIEKSIITDWIYEINKPIFFCVLVLIAVGLFISLTINPGTSRYINNNLFSYFNIQALYLLSGFILFILFSFINYERISNISIIAFVILIVVLFLTLIYGVEIKGSEVLLLGAGGAARAAATRCLQSGCSRLWLGNRSTERLTEVVEILSTSFESDRICPFPLNDIPKQIFKVENLIVINATSLGLRETDPCPVELINFRPSSKIYDMIYNPPVTKLLHAAKQLDLTHANGLSMLVHQAAQALELWTQEEICVASMYQGIGDIN